MKQCRKPWCLFGMNIWPLRVDYMVYSVLYDDSIAFFAPHLFHPQYCQCWRFVKLDIHREDVSLIYDLRHFDTLQCRRLSSPYLIILSPVETAILNWGKFTPWLGQIPSQIIRKYNGISRDPKGVNLPELKMVALTGKMSMIPHTLFVYSFDGHDQFSVFVCCRYSWLHFCFYG